MIKKLRQAPRWLLTLLLITITISANAYDVLIDNIYYNISYGKAYVADAYSDIKTANILSEVEYNGKSYPVTYIYDYAFSGCSSLTSVTIPESVTSIGNSAFSGCSSLIKSAYPSHLNNPFSRGVSIAYPTNCSKDEYGVIYDKDKIEVYYAPLYLSKYYKIPESITTIEPNAYNGCSSLTSMNIPENVTSIGDSAFSSCSSLTSMNIPENVTSISDYAFANCSSLTSVTIPENVTSIGSSAFNGCSSLTSVTIPENVTSIGSSAFSGCSNLTSLTFNATNCTTCGSYDYPAFPSSITSLTIGENVTIIPSYAFKGCSSLLTSVTIPENVSSIGSYAFYGCSSFTSVTIPENVTSIGSSAFSGCSSLTSMTIPEGVTFIGDFAFERCSSLTSVTIPENVTSIGDRAFYGCSNLTSLTYNATNCTTCGSYDYPAFPSSITSLTIGENVTSIPSYAFKGCSSLLTSVTIPENASSIGSYAFYGCSKIERLEIPKSVVSIGSYAFFNNQLKSLTLGSGLLSIGSKAFSYSNGSSTYNKVIPKVLWLGNTPPSGYNEISASVNYVANDQYNVSNKVIYQFLSSRFVVDGSVYVPVSPAERTCDLIDCTYDPEVKEINITDKVVNRGIELTVNDIRPYTYYGNQYITSLSLANNGFIGQYAFYGVNGAESLNVSNNGCIGAYAFAECSSIKSATIANTSYIDEYAFNNCTSLLETTVSNKGNLGKYAFSGCSSLQTANISNEGYVGDYSFKDCLSLQTATLSNKSYIGVSAFEGDKKLVSVSIGENVTAINSRAFYDCTSLESVEISEGVTSFGNSAFYNCSSIPSFEIPNSVTSLGESAFAVCSSLESIKIGAGLSTLPNQLFYGCKALNNLIIPNNISSIGNNVFTSCSALSKLTIEDPAEKEDKEPTRENLTFPDWTSTNHASNSRQEKEYTIQVEIGDVLTFNYSVSSESGYDYLTIYLNGSQIDKISGSSTKSYSTQFNVAGTVTLRMEYSKDGSNDSGQDQGSVYDIVLHTDGSVVNDTALTLGSKGSSPLFQDCPLDEVYIGRKLRYNTSSSYGYSPFYRNTSLRVVEISDTETQVSDNEFYGCSNLKSITIGNGVTSIGNWAFSGCSSLDYFSAGYNVKTIGKEAFSDCTAMTTYHSFSVEPPVCGDQALDDINKWECTLYVPAESSDEYAVAPQWKEFFFVNETDAVLVESLTISPEMLIGKTGDTDTLMATVEPANATRPQLNWTSEDETVATVDENGVVTYLKEGTTIITAHTTDGSSISASIEVLVSVKDPVTGDSNANGVVNVADAVNTANYAVGNEVTIFDVVAADVNKDGKITLSDASATIELILNQPSVETNVKAEMRCSAGSSDVINVSDFEASEGENVQIPVYLGDLREYVALQGEIVVPEGMTLIGIEAGCAVSGSHSLATKMNGSNRMRFVLFNSANEVINTANGEILTLTVRVNTVNQSPIEMQNVIAADAIAREYRCASTGGANMLTTGLGELTESDIRVEVENDTVMIYNADGLVINVYSAAGTLEARFVSAMEIEKCELAPGVHIISVTGKSFKVIIK